MDGATPEVGTHSYTETWKCICLHWAPSQTSTVEITSLVPGSSQMPGGHREHVRPVNWGTNPSMVRVSAGSLSTGAGQRKVSGRGTSTYGHRAESAGVKVRGGPPRKPCPSHASRALPKNLYWCEASVGSGERRVDGHAQKVIRCLRFAPAKPDGMGMPSRYSPSRTVPNDRRRHSVNGIPSFRGP